MTSFMVGNYLFFPGAYFAALPFRPGKHPVYGFIKFLHSNAFPVPPGSKNSSLVNQIGQVSAAESYCTFCQHFQINRFIQRLAIGMNF